MNDSRDLGTGGQELKSVDYYLKEIDGYGGDSGEEGSANLRTTTKFGIYKRTKKDDVQVKQEEKEDDDETTADNVTVPTSINKNVEFSEPGTKIGFLRKLAPKNQKNEIQEVKSLLLAPKEVKEEAEEHQEITENHSNGVDTKINNSAISAKPKKRSLLLGLIGDKQPPFGGR